MNNETETSKPADLLERYGRIDELLAQFDVGDTDELKHRLEDHERWRKDVVELSIASADHISEIESLLWNLGGCDAIASGWSKPFEYNKEMARPALDSVSRLAAKVELAESKLSQLQLTISFFASVIKSGESWSEVCQEHLDKSRGGQQ